MCHKITETSHTKHSNMPQNHWNRPHTTLKWVTKSLKQTTHNTETGHKQDSNTPHTTMKYATNNSQTCPETLRGCTQHSNKHHKKKKTHMPQTILKQNTHNTRHATHNTETGHTHYWSRLQRSLKQATHNTQIGPTQYWNKPPNRAQAWHTCR